MKAWNGREIYGHISKSWKLRWKAAEWCWMKGLMATKTDLVTRICLENPWFYIISCLVVSCLDSLKQVFILLKCKLFLVWWIHYRNLKQVFILLKCKPRMDVLDFRTTSRTGGSCFSSRRHALRIAWLAFMTLMAMGAWNPRAQQDYLQMAMTGAIVYVTLGKTMLCLPPMSENGKRA